MKKEFIKELTELINKHGLESEMRDTPDYILAQVCVDAMAVFSESIARRDEWHGFKTADKPKHEKSKNQTQIEIPAYVKNVAEKLGQALDATVEIHRIEFPVNKRRFRKKFNKAPKGKKSNIEENDSDLDKKIGEVLQEMSKRGNKFVLYSMTKRMAENAFFTLKYMEITNKNKLSWIKIHI